MEQIVVITGTVIFLVFAGIGFCVLSYKKIPQGKSIIRTGIGGTKVAFNEGLYVIPFLHNIELLDISYKKILIERMRHDGVICKDNIRADIKIAFYLKVNESAQDVINVAQTIGCERAGDVAVLKEFFEARFIEAVNIAGKKFEFLRLCDARREFRDEIMNIIGADLNGFVLEDCAIESVEQTQLQFLNPESVQDSEGIELIMTQVVAKNVKANQLRHEEEEVIKKQNLMAQEKLLELECLLIEAQERQKREVENLRLGELVEEQKTVGYDYKPGESD